MGIIVDTRSDTGSYEVINGYRSSSGSVPKGATNNCDIILHLQDPFDFKIDWRSKWLKVKNPFTSNSGKVYYRTTKKYIPYPYYTFQTKGRTVTEWKFVLASGLEAIEKSNFRHKTPELMMRVGWLQKALKPYGKCIPLKKRPLNIQHNVSHYKVSAIGIPTATTYKGVVFGHKPTSAYTYGYSLYESSFGKITKGDHGVPSLTHTQYFNSRMNSGLGKSIGIYRTAPSISALTSMLWPSSDDLEKVQSKPLIDIAEAISDGSFPLGPPPSPAEAHSKMVGNAMKDDMFAYLTDIVDFASNSWLYSTLVIEPIVSSAIGLAASVVANDKAIEAFGSLAASGKWIQGKNMRIFGQNAKNAATCLGFPMTPVITSVQPNPTDPYRGYDSFTDRRVTYNKCEANASFFYCLSNFDAAVMNTSGARLGQYFNRMSSSFDTILHNIIPLSFVYDWFSSEYTGRLNLKDKVYLPLDQWKLTVSTKVQFDIRGENVDKIYESLCVNYTSSNGPKGRWIETSRSWESGHKNDVPPYYAGFGNYYYKKVVVDRKTSEFKTTSDERHELYDRVVYDNPDRLTAVPETLVECLDTIKLNAIDDVGKQVTLAALIWGLIS